MEKTTRLFSRSMGQWLMALLLVMLSSLAAKAAEAYACYTSSNTTLTFYYDNLRASRTGTTYDLNTDYNDTEWETSGTNADVTRVVFDSSFANARPTITYAWFYGMGNLQSITGISYLNTSEVTNMAWMFGQCENLTSLDLSGFNTANVTDMRGMFTRCNKLTTIYASSSWSTAAVTDSFNMFNDCTSLVGGMGTTYNSSHVDKAYAHIDGGTSNPGYFTRDPNSPEAYACYTSSNTTLTFYYDNLRSSRTGTTYDLNTGSNITGWETSGTNANVTKVVFNSSFANARPTTTYSWFYGMGNLQSITGMKEYLKTSAVTNMAWMFSESTKLTTIDLSGFNTAKVTDMRGMFSSCNMLTTIYVGSGWSTAAVTSSYSMFENCTNLVGGKGTTYNSSHTDKAYAHIDGGTSNPGYLTDPNVLTAYACYTPSNTTLTFYYDNQRNSRTGTTYILNTSYNYPSWYSDSTCRSVTKVVFNSSFAAARPTSTFGWFYNMSKLTSITGISYLNTESVTNMGVMFCYCSSLTSLNVSNFNTSKVTNMGGMFTKCTGLTSLDLSSFNTAKVTDMGNMFENCSNLTTIYVGSEWSTAAVTISNVMFLNCTSLVGGKGTTYNANHTDKAYAHIDGGTSNPGYFTGPMAYACYTPDNTTLTFYYDSQRSTRPGTTYDLNTEQNLPGWHYNNITKVVFNPSFADARPTTTYRWFDGLTKLTTITGRNYLNTSEVTDMGYMFYTCSSLTSLDLSNFNTSKVTDMQYMFYGCSSLTSLNLSNFNTSNVTKMGCMFQDCSGLTSLNVSSFNTSNVTWMSSIFAGCSGLTSLNLSNFNTANVTSMLNMFAYCSSLTSLNVSSFNTSNVTEMGFMFSNCSSLTSLDLSSFNTSQVTYMGYMFSGCTRLTSLDLSSFNTSKATYMGEMFSGCTRLTSLDLSSFNTSKVTNMGRMFQDCSNLQTVYVDSSWSTAAVASSYNMFSNCTSLVGGQGTTYDANHVDAAYAHIDGGVYYPGYFSVYPAFTRGDVNGDGQVKISDVTALINYLLSGNGSAINLQAADCNQDGQVKIADVTALINYLLSGSW